VSVNADEHVQVPVLPDAAKTIVPTLEQLVKPAAVHLLSVSVVEAVAAIVDSARELVQPDGMLYTSLESGRICAKICDTGNIPIQLNFMEARATVTPVMPPALPVVLAALFGMSPLVKARQLSTPAPPLEGPAIMQFCAPFARPIVIVPFVVNGDPETVSKTEGTEIPTLVKPLPPLGVP
jgi:hypothetical protein